MTVTADVYRRKSTDDRGRSVADQLAEAREAIEERGWTLGKIFTDDNQSASRFARKNQRREDFAALLVHLASGDCEMLILWESSRGSRKLPEWSQFLEICREHGVLIFVVSHGRTYDCRISRDWKVLANDGVDAHAESNIISDRALRGARRGAAAGRPAGKLQFGFRRVYDDSGAFSEQVEDPAQGAIVREAARRVLKGESCNSIAVDFNDRGIPGPTGGRWDLTQIKRLCVTPSYAGFRVHRGEVIGKAVWDGIHDEATYAALLGRLNDPKRRNQRDGSLKHVLSGLVRCALCDSRMGVLRNRGVQRYCCKGCLGTAARTTPLEEFVVEVVLTRLERDDAADLFRTPASGDALAEAEALAAELEGRLAPFYAEAAGGRLSAAGLAAIEADLLPKIDLARARVKAARVAPVPEPIRALAGQARAKWPELNVHQRRETIGLLISELRVSPVGRGKRIFDPMRLRESRWVGDDLTWGDHWTTEGHG